MDPCLTGVARRHFPSPRRQRNTTSPTDDVTASHYADSVSADSSTAVPRCPIGPADLCHCVPNRMPFTREGWIFELKHDGFRALARTGAGQALLSRSPATANGVILCSES